MELFPVVILFSTLVFFFILGMPVAYCMGLSSLCYILAVGDIPLQAIAQKMIFAGDNFVLIAIPLFILAAHVMNSTETSQRLFRFANTFVRHWRGGLAHVNVITSMIFAGMSGSAMADAAGPGLMEYEAMKDAGYDEDFSIAVTAASSTIGPIIPPSVPFVMFAWVAGVSVGKLFIAGIIPGILMGIVMMIISYLYAKRNNIPIQPRATFREIVDAFKKAILPLLAPLIILGGIYTGVVTATEAAMIATLYAIAIGVFAFRRLNLKDFLELCLRVAKDTAVAMFIVATATAFNWILTREQIPLQLSEFLLNISTNPVVILLIVNLFLVVLGMFMENTAITIVFTPILLPVMLSIGVDPIHFGVFFTLNMMLAVITPPFGIVLFILSGITKIPIGRISKAMIPFYIGLFALLFVVTFVPEISLFLPRMLGQ